MQLLCATIGNMSRTTTTKKSTKAKRTARTATRKATSKTTRTKSSTASRSTSKTSPRQSSQRSAGNSPHQPVRREPLAHLWIETELRNAGFRGGLSTKKADLARYSTDESIFSIKPQIILQPRDAKDIATAVQCIGTHTARFPALSLTPRAAGTGLSGGSLTDSIVLDVTTHLNHIHNATKKHGQITFTCGPGAMWRDVEAMLKKHHAYIPSYPASKDICTIGGAVANNAAGPDSLRFGHCADWVEALEVILSDGKEYTIKPLTYKQLQTLIKKTHAHARIAKEVFDLIVKNEKTITNARPHTAKNSAGYALWDVLDVSVAKFKRGEGHFDLTRLFSGSQGTIGIITNITMRATPIPTDTDLIVVPVFNLADTAKVITKALTYKPRNVELFDGATFDLALQNPTFFKDRLPTLLYYKVLVSLYTTFHVRYRRKTPVFTLLITTDDAEDTPKQDIVPALQAIIGKRARRIQNPVEREMFWQIRRASYTLSKFQNTHKRPAAFLEDMTVPPENISSFFAAIQKLLKKYNVTAAVHGHGGNGHLHFYPLLDFTSKSTPALIEKMAEEFFATAVKFDGNICGEHNDGIIRTPHLSKMFSKKVLGLFAATEAIFDPDDIFNPGKKVNPRYDILESMRTTNF